jgi:arylformamidase
LVGVDYLSVAQYADAAEVHKILLSKEVVLLEGIRLHNVDEGEYELIALPVNIAGAEGAPVRAVLIER